MNKTTPQTESKQLYSVFPHLQKEFQSLQSRSGKLKMEVARMLVADDTEMSRELLSDYLKELGHVVETAANGEEALALVKSRHFDLIFLDVLMPKMTGYGVLENLKADPELRNIPVIMTSGIEDLKSVATCIEMGADDYLSKPLNFSILKARVSGCLEKRRLGDLEKGYIRQIELTHRLNEQLLNNILPPAIAERLKNGEETIAEFFPDVTILFADIVNFTELSSRKQPSELVRLLNVIFSDFDRLAEEFSLEKIKTIGDAYMVAGGLLNSDRDGTEAAAGLAIRMQEEIPKLGIGEGGPLSLRIGMNTGPVIAGVIGIKKISFDVWGDTVNVASRMQSEGIPGCIQVTQSTYERLKDKFTLETRGQVEIKGRGGMPTYLLKAKK